jgi:hypothetical protein
MITLQFPFPIEHPEVKRGFEQGQNPEYQSTKPVTDAELVGLVSDFLKDDEQRLAYNLGFLMGLYIK